MFGLINGVKKKRHAAAAAMPITRATYVVLDTELTGLDEKKDSIVSIGAVRMNGAVIELGSTFYRLVNPRTELMASSIVVHHITPSDVEEKPDIEMVLSEFMKYCGDSILVGHFIMVDLNFLNAELKRLGGGPLPNPALDTFSIHEWLRKRGRVGACPATLQGGYRLYDLIKCFGMASNGAHNALMDAFATAQLFQRFIPLLTEERVDDVTNLVHLGTPFKGGDHFGLTNEFSNF